MAIPVWGIKRGYRTGDRKKSVGKKEKCFPFPERTRTFFRSFPKYHQVDVRCQTSATNHRIFRSMKMFFFTIVVALGLAPLAVAFDYNITGLGGIALTDEMSGIGDINTIFTGAKSFVEVTGIEWSESDEPDDSLVIYWETLVDGVVQDTGNTSLAGTRRMLPSSISAGTVQVKQSGRSTIEVKISLSGSKDASTKRSYEVYAPGVSIIPLLLIFFLAMFTRMVELSLFSGVFVGSCIIVGNIKGK
jgi:hypothetical protein